MQSNNEMLYTYFKPVLKQEHYLFAGEIAQLFNIQTRTGKIADTFVSAYLKEAVKRSDSYEQLYYSTKYGMNRVYPAHFYVPIMSNLVKTIGYNTEFKIVVNNKNYYIKAVK